MHEIDIFFLIGIIMVCFDFTPWSIFVSGKKGENIVLLFSLTPLLMIDKKGEKYLSLYACLSKFALFHIDIKRVCFMFCWYWYQEYGY